MSDVNVSYKKRESRIPKVTEQEDGTFLVELEGYEDTYAKDLEDLEKKLEELWQKEQVRLSYKKG